MALWRNYQVLQKNSYRDWLFASDTGKVQALQSNGLKFQQKLQCYFLIQKGSRRIFFVPCWKNKPDLPWTSPVKAQKGQEILKAQCDPFLNVAKHVFFITEVLNWIMENNSPQEGVNFPNERLIWHLKLQCFNLCMQFAYCPNYSEQHLALLRTRDGALQNQLYGYFKISRILPFQVLFKFIQTVAKFTHKVAQEMRQTVKYLYVVYGQYSKSYRNTVYTD